MFAVAPESQPATEDDLWHALADPTRRQLLDHLAGGAKTTGDLCAGFAMSRFGVMKHLGILERTGLVTARKQGRQRLNHLNAAPLARLQARWLSPRASGFAQAIDRLSRAAEENDMADDNPLRTVEIALDWEIAASPQRLWRLIFDSPEAWWPADFRAVAGGATMRFEDRLGGQLREEAADGSGLVWYQVVALEPQRSLDLSGQLASRYGGPATSMLHLTLEPGQAEGSTLLKLTDSVFGRLGEGFQASAASGWQAIVGEGLKPHAEGAAL
jgi:DNA-binding transcriptional ArsR family regulator/uncharacterized protein YndB with AHSA1/START domain